MKTFTQFLEGYKDNPSVEDVMKVIEKHPDKFRHKFPQKPKFDGSFNYQSGSSRTFCIPYKGVWIPTSSEKAIEAGKEGFILRYVEAFTISWVWVDNKWKLKMKKITTEPEVKKKTWEIWK